MFRKVLKTYDRKNNGKNNFSTAQTQSVFKPMETQKTEDKKSLNDTLEDPFNTTFDRLLKEYKDKPIPPPIPGLSYIETNSDNDKDSTFEYKSKTQKKKPRLKKQSSSPKKPEKNAAKISNLEKEKKTKKLRKNELKKSAKVDNKKDQQKMKLPVRRKRRLSSSESQDDENDLIPDKGLLQNGNKNKSNKTSKFDFATSSRNSETNLKTCSIPLQPCDWMLKKKEAVLKIKPCSIQISRTKETVIKKSKVEKFLRNTTEEELNKSTKEKKKEEVKSRKKVKPDNKLRKSEISNEEKENESRKNKNNLGEITRPVSIKKCIVSLTRVNSPKTPITTRLISSTPFMTKKKNTILDEFSAMNLEISKIGSDRIPFVEPKTSFNQFKEPSVQLEDVNKLQTDSFRNNNETENWNNSSDYSAIDWETVSYTESQLAKEPSLQAKYRSNFFGNDISKSARVNSPEKSTSDVKGSGENLKVSLKQHIFKKILNKSPEYESSKSMFDDTDFKDSPMTSIPKNIVSSLGTEDAKSSFAEEGNKKIFRSLAFEESATPDFKSPRKYLSFDQDISLEKSEPSNIECKFSAKQNKVESAESIRKTVESDQTVEDKSDLKMTPVKMENSADGKARSKGNKDRSSFENESPKSQKSFIDSSRNSPVDESQSSRSSPSNASQNSDNSHSSYNDGSQNYVLVVSPDSLNDENQNSILDISHDSDKGEKNSAKDGEDSAKGGEDSAKDDEISARDGENSANSIKNSQESLQDESQNSLENDTQNPLENDTQNSLENDLISSQHYLNDSQETIIYEDFKVKCQMNPKSSRKFANEGKVVLENSPSDVPEKLTEDLQNKRQKNLVDLAENVEDSTQILVDSTQTLVDPTQNFGDLTQNVEDSTQILVDSTQNLVDSTQNFGDLTQNVEDSTQNLGDSTQTLEDSTSNFEDLSEGVKNKNLKPMAVNSSKVNSLIKELKDPVGITYRRKKYKNWGLQLSAITENESKCLSDSEIEVSVTPEADLLEENEIVPRETVSLNDNASLDDNKNEEVQEQHLFLKPGKSWARSLSILNNIHSRNDVDRLSVGKGSKWRNSVISILDMQNKGILQSCAKQHDPSKSPSKHEVVNKNVEQTKIERFSQLGSVSPNRFVKRISIRVVPDNNKLDGIEDTQFLEAYGITPSQSSQRFSSTQESILTAPSQENVIFNDHFEDSVNKAVDSQSLVTAKAVVLEKCRQENYLPFKQCYPQKFLKSCRKIGEGVYGEVFLYEHESDSSVIKIIPIEGSDLVNGEHQKKFHEILSEIVIAKELHDLRFNEKYNTSSFVEVKNIKCIQGKYPQKLVELWQDFDDEKKSENDCPSMFQNDQLYISLELGNGGQDLEAFVFQNANEAYSVFIQTALALAVAEKSLEFEHRDLHWGNILISRTKKSKISYKLGNTEINLNSNGLKVAIIDFTLSRMSYNGCFIFNDLALDPSLFTAEGEYQFEIYRLMRDQLGNNWQTFDPFTNILWLHYTLDKMITSVRYNKKKKLTKIHKNGIEELKEMKAEILSYDSAYDLVTKCDKFTAFYDNLNFSTADSA